MPALESLAASVHSERGPVGSPTLRTNSLMGIPRRLSLTQICVSQSRPSIAGTAVYALL